jgi:hypothetical protein
MDHAVMELQEKNVSRSAQPHVHMYMFCPYVISMPYQLHGEYKCEFSKGTFFVHSSYNFTPKKNELRYHCCLSQLYFIVASFLLQQKDRVVLAAQDY